MPNSYPIATLLQEELSSTITCRWSNQAGKINSTAGQFAWCLALHETPCKLLMLSLKSEYHKSLNAGTVLAPLYINIIIVLLHVTL